MSSESSTLCFSKDSILLSTIGFSFPKSHYR
nr:MAG TPA: hypothetical protein [Caudoviricetes sp.]